MTPAAAAAATASRHEGRPGIRIDELRADVPWAALQPDVVLLLVGTNDATNSTSSGEMERRYDALLQHVHAQAPAAKVVIASLLALGNASAEHRSALVRFNRRLPAVVARARARSNPVYLVDLAAHAPRLCDATSGALVGHAPPLCSSPEVSVEGWGWGRWMSACLCVFYEWISRGRANVLLNLRDGSFHTRPPVDR